MKSLLSTFVVGMITAFLFSCGEEGPEGPLEGNGNITFYFNDPMPCTTLEIVFINLDGSESRGTIQGHRVFSGVPACSEVPSISFMNRPYGDYTYSIICGTYSLGGEVNLRNPCQTIKLEPPE